MRNMNKVFNKPDYFYLAIALTMTTLVIGAVVTTVDVFKAEKKIERFDEGMVMENEQVEELNFEQLEVSSSGGGEVKNIIADANDKRSKSYEDWSQDVNVSSSSNPEQSAKEFEQQLFREAEGNEARKKMEEQRKNKDNSSSPKNTKQENKTSLGGSENQFAGNVMVRFSLSGRTAFNGNNWYVRNPGYTCGRGAGVVVVNVVVGRDGKVIKAIVDNAKSSGNSCMKEQAQKYASMSRFSISNSSPEEHSGYIRYEFVSQ
jgi:hypothetical protein